MTPGPLPSVDVPDPRRQAGPPGCAPLPTRLGAATPGPDDPMAVVVAGPAGAGRREVIAGLLGIDSATLAVPAGSNLLVQHAEKATRAAYVPGYRQPHAYGADPMATGPALARPPRRVELSLPDPLLRHFAVVDTPDTGTLGVAGGRVLRDAVGRAGALLFVISADQAFSAAELHLLAEMARARVEVFFAVTPGTTGWTASADGPAAEATRSVRPPARPGVGLHRGAPRGAAGRGAGAHPGPVVPGPPGRAAAPAACPGRLGRRRGTAPRQRKPAGAARRARPGAGAGRRRARRAGRPDRQGVPSLRPPDPSAPRPGVGEHPPAGGAGDRLRGRLRRPAADARPRTGGAVAARHRAVRRGRPRSRRRRRRPGLRRAAGRGRTRADRARGAL